MVASSNQNEGMEEHTKTYIISAMSITDWSIDWTENMIYTTQSKYPVDIEMVLSDQENHHWSENRTTLILIQLTIWIVFAL